MTDAPLPVIATLQEKCCLRCEFYFFEGKICRRFPPAVIVIERKKGGEFRFASKFPPMTPDGLCGEFKEIKK